jgi:hypothetical protein
MQFIVFEISGGSTLSFQDFIDRIGAVNLAIMLDCTEASIYKWRSAQSAPRPETAYILTQLSHGQLTLEAIFMPYIKKQLHGTTFKVGALRGGSGTAELSFDFERG